MSVTFMMYLLLLSWTNAKHNFSPHIVQVTTTQDGPNTTQHLVFNHQTVLTNTHSDSCSVSDKTHSEYNYIESNMSLY